MLAHNQSGYVIFRLFLSRTITSSSFNFVPYMEVVSSPFLRRLQVKRVLRTKGWNSKYFTEYVTSSKEPWKRKFVKKWKQLSGNNLLVYLSLFLVVAVAAAVDLFCYLPMRFWYVYFRMSEVSCFCRFFLVSWRVS